MSFHLEFPPYTVRPSEYGGHWLEGYQGHRDSHIRAMTNMEIAKAKIFNMAILECDYHFREVAIKTQHMAVPE